jgi:hypothetical protein
MVEWIEEGDWKDYRREWRKDKKGNIGDVWGG